MKFIAFTLFTTLSLNLFALESDQYLVIGMELKDLRQSLNNHVNATVQKELDLANQKGLKANACAKIHEGAVKRFRGFFIHKIETWLEHEHGQDIYPTADVSLPRYYNQSLYGWRYGFIAQFFPMGRNLQIGDIQIGQDKLAHFFSTGLRYYVKYKKLLKKKNMTEQEALEKTIDYGITMENTYLGLWPAGIFSFADLEANYQGLLFNQRFCEGGEKSYLAYQDGKWILQNRADMGEFINPNMNEVFNPSYFGFWRWSKIKDNLAKRCELTSNPAVGARLERYRQISRPSLSIDYINRLLQTGDKSVPDRSRQVIKNFCPGL